MTKIGIVDDHPLFLKSLSLLLKYIPDTELILQASNGKDLQNKLNPAILPDLILLDVNMPQMSGVETAQWIKKNYPRVKLAALSMNDNELVIRAMMNAGCCAYLFKSMHPTELEKAIQQIVNFGSYFPDEFPEHLKKDMNSKNKNFPESNNEKNRF